MTIDTKDLINSIMDSLDRVKFMDSDDIPNIDLYVDQVTTIMDKALNSTLRYKGGADKVLTKTMVNNYAKNDLLPPPNKKKYSKEHVLVLVFIYYFKNILSISDIQALLGPITDKYFGNAPGLSFKDIYDEVATLDFVKIEDLKKDVQAKYEQASESFKDADDSDKEFLQIFAFICELVFDVYVKKLLIEKLIDQLADKKE